MPHFRLEVFILPHAPSHLLPETFRLPARSIRDSSSDLDPPAREVESLGVCREVGGGSQLDPAQAYHLQALIPFHGFDVAAEVIEECLVEGDGVGLRAQGLEVVGLEVSPGAEVGFVVLCHGPSVARERGDVPEMVEAGVGLSDAELAGPEVSIYVSSVPCALLVAHTYCIVCCFAGRYQSHAEKFPVRSETVPSLNGGTAIHGIGFDIVDLVL